MSNTIQPYDASRSGLQRSVRSSDQEDDASRLDSKRIDLVQPKSTLGKGDSEQAENQDKVDQTSAKASPASIDPSVGTTTRFVSTEANSIKNPGQVNPKLDGLTQDEQQLIYRYFPESPSLELRLYKPDMSTDKVDPGSVGSRVDLRG